MYAECRDTMYNNGYIPLPVNGKAPFIKRFLDDNYKPPIGYNGANIAIVCGKGENPICAIDIDVMDKDTVDALLIYTFTNYKPTICRVGNAPKTLLMYRAEKPGIRKLQTSVFKEGQVEILGYGQTCITHGIHVDTQRPYIWTDNNILQVPARELPILTEAQIKHLLYKYEEILLECKCTLVEKNRSTDRNTKYDPNDTLTVKNPIGVPEDQIIAKLSRIDPDCSRNQWLRVGMAIHHETQGKGLKLWDSWSAGGSKYNADEMRGQWDSFKNKDIEPVTFAYILKLTADSENTAPVEPPLKVSDTPNTYTSVVFKPTWDNEPEKPEPLLELQGHRILSRGSLAVISAPAGQGKTQMVSAICASVLDKMGDIDTLGFSSQASTALYIDTEQSVWEHHVTWQRFMRRLNKEKGDTIPNRVHFHLITDMEKLKDRQSYLYKVLNDENVPDIIILDGIGDYVNDVNNAPECVPLVYQLSAYAKRRNIGILTTLHVNPVMNAEKLRGALGSELWRKAEFSAIIKRVDAETRCLTTEYALGKVRSDTDLITQHFKWCSITKMMISCGAPVTLSKKDKQEAVPEVAQSILDMLLNMGNVEVIKSDITAALPYSRYNIDRAFSQLKQDDLIKTCRKGNKLYIRLTNKNYEPQEELKLW